MTSTPAAVERLSRYAEALKRNPFDTLVALETDDLRAVLAALSRLEEENAKLAKAVFMVGNMDTEHDKAAWWADHQADWERAASLTKGGADV